MKMRTYQPRQSLHNQSLVSEVGGRNQISEVVGEQVLYLLNSIDDAILCLDKHLHVTWLNSGASILLGVSPTTTGIPLEQAWPALNGNDLAAMLQSAQREGAIDGLVLDFMRDGNTPCTVKLQLVATPDVTPEHSGYALWIREVTPARTTESQLQETQTAWRQDKERLSLTLAQLDKANEALKTAQSLLVHAEKMETVGQLAASVTHEVKNPLAVLLSGLEFLNSAMPANDQDVRLVLGDMGDALKRANHVIRGLLDYAGSQEIGVQALDLNQMVEVTLSLLRYDLIRNKIKVDKSLAAGLPPLNLDRNQIEQALLNVFINAIHAMPNGGTLTIASSQIQIEQSQVPDGCPRHLAMQLATTCCFTVLTVEDSGTGIPVAQMKHLFEPFFTTKPAGQGTGLGLAVTRKILESHGAGIDIKNRTEGGVRVTLWFPTPFSS